VKLESTFRQTDIIGALLLAGQILQQQTEAQRRILVLYSDMRNCTPELNLDSPMVGQNAEQKKLHLPMADLHGVQTYALGVNGADKSLVAWQNLKHFWQDYFRRSGSILRNYSVLRMFGMCARECS